MSFRPREPKAHLGQNPRNDRSFPFSSVRYRNLETTRRRPLRANNRIAEKETTRGGRISFRRELAEARRGATDLLREALARQRGGERSPPPPPPPPMRKSSSAAS
ncbi:hypothetical protein NL676_017725 [Syzygium grande]|nr:hypothetical protein NL676_017725 [Syzygium grande]